MIHGIGVDILRVERMAALHARHGERLLRKILSAAEREAFVLARDPAAYLAKAFAAKEAMVKALGSGFRGVGYADVTTLRESTGRPALAFSAALQRRLDDLGIVHAHLSLSDDAGLACAMVVLER